MSFRSRAPRRKADGLDWSFEKCPAGTRIKGWLAGPVCGVPSHFADVTRPCRQELTSGALSCRFCVANFERDWSGYSPVFTDDGRRIVVIIKRAQFEFVEQIKLHSCVLVSRDRDNEFAPVRITPYSWSATPMAGSHTRKQSQDISDWCLQLWGDTELRDWLDVDLARMRLLTAPHNVEPPPSTTPAPDATLFEAEKVEEKTVNDDPEQLARAKQNLQTFLKAHTNGRSRKKTSD